MVRHVLLGLALLALAIGCSKKKPAESSADEDGAKKIVIGDTNDKAWETAVANLKSKSSASRGNGMRSISQYDAAETFPVFTALLADRTYSQGERIPGEANSAREAAIVGLLKYGPAGEKVALDKGLPFLIAALKDNDTQVRLHAAIAIGLLGPKAKAATGNLLSLCESVEPDVRQVAFVTLGKIGGSSPTDFVLMLSNADPLIVLDAARALNAIRPLPKEILPALLPLIEKPPAENDREELMLVRLEVAEMLGSFGKEAEEAVVPLAAVLKATTEEDFIKYYRPKSSREASTALDESPVMAALRKIGKPAVPALIEMLGSKNAFHVWMAARVLSAIGPDAAEAIPTLQKIFDGEADKLMPDMLLVSTSGLAMSQLGADSEPLVAKIAELLTLATPNQKYSAAMTLARFGRKGAAAVPAIVKLLDDENVVLREQAILTLSAFGPAAKEAVPALGAKLADPDFDVRRGAVSVLKALGPLAAPIAPQLCKQLGEQDEALRREVLEALAALGDQVPADVAAIAALLPSQDDKERVLVLEALGSQGANAKSAIPAIVKDFRGSPLMKAATLRALGRIGQPTPEALALLGERLDRGETVERKASARALALMGPAAKAATPQLQKLAMSKDPASGVWAATALYRLGVNPDSQLAVITNALKTRTPGTGQGGRLAAMDFADLLGPSAKGIIPELIASLDDRTPISQFDKSPVCVRAATALGKMGPAAKDAVKRLALMLKDVDPVLKKAAIESLGQIGPDAKPAAARLREIVRTEPALAETAQEALERIEPKS